MPANLIQVGPKGSPAPDGPPKLPLLIVGDSPTLPSGLGRIARDLAELIRRHVPEVRVAQLGLKYRGERCNWHVYPMHDEVSWGQRDIGAAWEDWAFETGGRGVVFTIWDPGRCPAVVWGLDQAWRGVPQRDPESGGRIEAPRLGGWKSRGLEMPHLWGYFAVDTQDASGRLGGPVPETLAQYQRVLGYTAFGAEVLGETLGGRAVPHLPHGLDLDTFSPRSRERELPAEVDPGWVSSGWPIIGVVATNTPRKDYGSVFAALEGVQCHLWIHCDKAVTEAWSIPELAAQFGRNDPGLLHHTEALDDEQMARWYSLCDATIAPGLGEGFGYPIVESLACATPVVGVNFAGGREFLPAAEWRLGVRAMRLEGPYALLRPVLDPGDLQATLREAVRWARAEPEVVREYCRAAVAHLDWRRLWPYWEKWVREGLEGLL